MTLRKNATGTFPVSIVASVICALTLAGCGGGNDDGFVASVKDVDGFFASVKDVAGYKTWEVADYTIGKSNPALGTAHMASDNAFSRRIFRGPSAKIAGGEYPDGSIIVKETFTWENGAKKFPAEGGIFAMVKRGKTFNPNGGGWEWLELSPDGSTIVARGGEDMMIGMCNGCHALAAKQPGGGDSVFPHRSEFAAVAADFTNYSKWDKIQETSVANALLGGAHNGSDPKAVRRIYKKQLLANADTAQAGHPVGTIIVKETLQNSAITEITAMVKRGGNFNAANNGWEWFMIDPSTSGIVAQGGDLLGGMCNVCHSQTKDPALGVDYVFKHPSDPFNK